MGRIAVPAQLKILKGRGEGRDSGGRPIPTPPKFVREAPGPPDWPDAESLAEWHRVAPGLEALDILKPEDRAALAVFCETWSRFVAAVRLYRAEGMVLTNPDSGNLRRHPAVGIAEATDAQLRTFAAEFGLTPASEQRIGAVTTDDGAGSAFDPFTG